MERLVKKRKENPGSTSTYANTVNDPGPSNATSYLLEQIGILKMRNQEILEEHQKTLHKYEDKLAENDQQLSTLKAEIASHSKGSHPVRTGTEVARLRWAADSERDEEMRLVNAEQELRQCRKVLADQKETRMELQKQLDVANRKIEDMMDITVNDKAEIKLLRSKLGTVDQDKAKFRPYQQEIDKLKKTIRQLETKHKSEIRTLTAKLEDEKKKCASQTKQRDASQVTLQAQLVTAEEQLETLRRELEAVMRNEKQLQFALQAAQEEHCNVRHLISRITGAYSDLKTRSVSLDKYEQTEDAYLTTRFRLFRLERRLADRDTVIKHLSAFCKQLAEEKFALKTLMEDLISERPASDFCQCLDDAMGLTIDVADNQIADLREENHLQRIEIDVLDTLKELYRSHSGNILDSYIISDIEASKLSGLQHHFIAQHSRMIQDLAEINAEKDRISEQMSLMSKQNEENQTKCSAFEIQLTEQQAQLSLMETTSRKDSKNIQRLTQTLCQSQKDKSHLQGEMARLSDDLDDALRYKEAHADLLSEVIALIQRNELAEAEAERLSRFNVEILSHKNPQQRIYYVDRIRTELAETKHELLRSTQEREVLATAAASLHSELAAYKSITVPIEEKPVGNRVRVKKSGLESLDINRLSSE